MKKRQSNLELLRIIAMIAIVAHHYVVNSDVMELFNYSNVNGNMIFLQLWSAWGKMAINCFVLISGYFMCTSRLTLKRYMKVYLTAKGYMIIIFCILAVVGIQAVSFRSIHKLIFGYLLRADVGFTGSFLVFYLFIPFYNLLLEKLDKIKHGSLVLMLLVFYSVVPTFFSNEAMTDPIIWYMTLYFVAAYIRLYPADWMKNNRICGSLLLTSLIATIVSILVDDFEGEEYYGYYLVGEANMVLAFLVGLFSFLFFNNLKVGYNKFVNSVAATTFGVLCIHANSDAMRMLIWKDILDVSSEYDDSLIGLMGHAGLSVVGVFVICSLIDMIRIRFIEQPILGWCEKKKFKREKHNQGED